MTHCKLSKLWKCAVALLFVAGCTVLFFHCTVHVPYVKEIAVTNLHGGETLRYPVAMVTGHIDLDPGTVPKSGTVPDSYRPMIQITNLDHPSAESTTFAFTHGLRFTLLVELSPGRNRLILSMGSIEARLKLNYRPSTSPYLVRLAYVLPSDGDIGFRGSLAL